ncbi:MAG: hypothetical protein ACKPKO_04135, partial [Candidatus Fonsibacter sp.]
PCNMVQVSCVQTPFHVIVQLLKLLERKLIKPPINVDVVKVQRLRDDKRASCKLSVGHPRMSLFPWLPLSDRVFHHHGIGS